MCLAFPKFTPWGHTENIWDVKLAKDIIERKEFRAVHIPTRIVIYTKNECRSIGQEGFGGACECPYQSRGTQSGDNPDGKSRNESELQPL